MQDLRTYQNLSDEALIGLYRQKQDTIFLGLVLQRYTALLIGVAYKYLRRQEEAEDATQHILLHALTHFPAETIQNLKGWLYILMRNHCLNELRKQKQFYHSDLAEDTAAENEPINEKELWQVELQLDRMKELLKQLPQQQQISLRLFYLEYKSYEDIISITGYDYMQVKSYIQNGKRKLRLLLLQEKVFNEKI